MLNMRVEKKYVLFFYFFRSVGITNYYYNFIKNSIGISTIYVNRTKKLIRCLFIWKQKKWRGEKNDGNVSIKNRQTRSEFEFQIVTMKYNTAVYLFWDEKVKTNGVRSKQKR